MFPQSPYDVDGRYIADPDLAERQRRLVADRAASAAARRERHAVVTLVRLATILDEVEGLGDVERDELLADLRALVGLPAAA